MTDLSADRVRTGDGVEGVSAETTVEQAEGVCADRPGRPFCVAVVGAGYWGPNLIRNFATLAGVRLAAICDVDGARLARVGASYPAVRTTTCLEDLLNDESVEGVAVATPAESHRAVVQSCLQAGKHVYVEKPLAASSADAEALAVLSAEVGRVLMVGHLFLYEPAMTALIRLVKEGAIGEIRYLHSIRTSMSGTARLDTNIVWDAFVHDAYVLPAVLGRWPSRVQAAGRGYLDARLEDVAIVTLDWGGGVFASVYVSWYALEKARRLTVIGSKGIVVWDDLAPARLTLFDRSYAPGEERDNRGRLRWHWHDGGAKIVEVPKGEPLRAECEHFVDCAMGRKRPMTDARAGAETVRLIEACNRSLRLDGAWVSMDGRSYASGSQG